MNQRRVKALRREARSIAEEKELDDIAYQEYWAPRYHIDHDEKTGMIKSITKVMKGRPVVMNACARRIYKDYKNDRIERRMDHAEKGMSGTFL